MIARPSHAALAAPLRADAGTTVVILFGIVTQLGDVWFLFLLGGLVHLAGDALVRPGAGRRRGLFVLALAVAYVALIETIKPTFGLPRPPGAGEPPGIRGLPPLLDGLIASVTTAEGPGFPSGHAMGTTMVWGGLALVLDRGSARARLGVAVAIVALVSLSRLVLGVHSIADVLAGATAGIVALAVFYVAADRGANPGRVLLVAVGVGLVGLLVTINFDNVAALGGAVGGWFAWRVVADRISPRPTSPAAAAIGAAVVAVGGVLFGTVYAIQPPYAVTFIGAALAVGSAVGAPYVGDRLARP